MSFPYHDRLWTDTAGFLRQHVRPDESVLAPDIFWWIFERIHRYRHARPEQLHDWAVIHKGELAELHPAYLRAVAAELRPVFANAVFVVLARREELPVAAHDAADVRSLTEAVAALPATKTDRESGRLGAVPAIAETIVKFETLDAEQFRDAMNWFWRSGGYVYATARDKAYFREIDSYIAEYLSDTAGQTILDLCCGNGRLRNAAINGAARVVGVDVSEVAIALARERHRDDSMFDFLVMDAAELAFSDASFDVVVFADAIEHVRRIETVFSEIARVLKPGGKLLTTVANTDSVNQIISAKLGYPRFKTNYQHIQEYNVGDFEELAARHGFRTVKSGGVFLFPYWGIPQIDDVVRDLTDNDPEVVELFRKLGRQIGPENAYAFVMLSEKRE